MKTITFKKYLIEKDNRKKIVKNVGLPQATADVLHGIHDKYSLWLANQIKAAVNSWHIPEVLSQLPDSVSQDTVLTHYYHSDDERVQRVPPMPILGEDALNADWEVTVGQFQALYDYIIKKEKTPENEEKVNTVLQNRVLQPGEMDIRNAITGIIDWVSNQNGQVSIKDYSFEEANAAQRVWHQREGETEQLLGQTGGIRVKTADEGPDHKDQSVVHKHSDNWFWLDLGTASSREEGTLMSRKDVEEDDRDGTHCGVDERADTLWSLRNGNKYIEVRGVEGNAPYLTIGVKAYTNTRGEERFAYTQFKGIGNRKPLPKFYEYIAEMFIAMKIDKLDETSYAIKDNFHVQDLPSDLFKKVVDALPAWMEESAVFLRAYREGMVGREQVEHFINDIENVTIQDETTIIYIQQNEISKLSNIFPIDTVIPFFFNDSYQQSPGDFIYKLNWQNYLPKEELNNALKYFSKNYNIPETGGRYIPNVIAATYDTEQGIKDIVKGIADSVKKLNKPILYRGYRLDKTPINVTYSFEDEFLKIEMSTDDFYDLFIEFYTQRGGSSRSSNGADILSTSQGNLNVTVTPEMILPELERDTMEILKKAILSNIQSTTDSTETLDFFGGDYEEDVDYNKKVNNILQGIQYEQRRHRRSSRYNIH